MCTHTPKVGAGGQGVVARGLTAALECLSCFFFFMLNGQKPKLERLISLLQTCCVCRFKSELNPVSSAAAFFVHFSPTASFILSERTEAAMNSRRTFECFHLRH